MAASNRRGNSTIVPLSLRGKFPNAWALMLEGKMRIVLEANLLVLSFVLLYATLVGPPHRSEWLYFLAAGLGPEAVALWYIVSPLNPYRSMVANREGMKGMDRTDNDAADFVAHLKSPDSRNFLLDRAWKLSLFLCVPMAVISVAMRAMPVWRFSADTVVRMLLFFVVCLFGLFRMEILAWAIKTWQ